MIGVEREVIPVDDVARSISAYEAKGFRLITISPADNPRWVDLDGPQLIRLDRAASTTHKITVSKEPLSIPPLVPELVISRVHDATHCKGRAGMRYRDLIPSRLGGRFIASHIKIPGAGSVPDYVHHHDVRFQMIFCHAGWVEVVYEDQGDPFLLRPGDAVIQPPGIRHRVLSSGDDLEVIEIGCPAEHDTHRDHNMELPNGIGDPKRRWRGQRFVHHVTSESSWSSTSDGWMSQSFGISEATDGLAQVCLARTLGPCEPSSTSLRQAGEFAFFFCRKGQLRLLIDGEEHEIPLSTGDSVTLHKGSRYSFGALDEAEMLVVTLGESY